MSIRLFLYDDPADAARFQPFALSRPLGELRYGAYLLRERWAASAGTTVAGHLAAAHLRDFSEPHAPAVVPEPGEAAEPRFLFRSTFVPPATVPLDAGMPKPIRFVTELGDTVGLALPAGTPWLGPRPAESWPTRTIEGGTLLAGIWQLIGDLPLVLRADLELLGAARGGGAVPQGCTVLGDPSLVMADEAAVEPHVVFDVRQGPIWLGAGVEVRTFTRLAGPLVVGAGTRLVGGQIRESAIGPRCVVQGEVSNSVFLGYANKAHDGFLGHSLVGRWVNIGAGTVTSNLKNTYGPVRLNLGAERVETGLMFLGALLGDHVKIAIGTMLPTGCVVGAGANLFGSKRPAAAVPPFAWGVDDPGRVLECRRFLETAARVMPRRDVTLDEAGRRYLAAVWQAATGRKCT